MKVGNFAWRGTSDALTPTAAQEKGSFSQAPVYQGPVVQSTPAPFQDEAQTSAPSATRRRRSAEGNGTALPSIPGVSNIEKINQAQGEDMYRGSLQDNSVLLFTYDKNGNLQGADNQQRFYFQENGRTQPRALEPLSSQEFAIKAAAKATDNVGANDLHGLYDEFLHHLENPAYGLGDALQVYGVDKQTGENIERYANNPLGSGLSDINKHYDNAIGRALGLSQAEFDQKADAIGMAGQTAIPIYGQARALGYLIAKALRNEPLNPQEQKDLLQMANMGRVSGPKPQVNSESAPASPASGTKVKSTGTAADAMSKQPSQAGKAGPSDSPPPAQLPKANVSEDALLPPDGDGIYPGKLGNQYVRIGDDLYQVRQDSQLKSWMIVDPANPYAFSGRAYLRKNEYGQWDVTDTPGLRGGSPLSRLLSPKYREARTELDRVIMASPKDGHALSDAQRQAFGDALTDLLKRGEGKADALHAIHEYVEGESKTINDALHSDQRTPEVETFLGEFDQLNAYAGTAYRAAYVTPAGAQQLRNGVGLTFEDKGVQSASTQPINAFGWENWADNVKAAESSQRVIYVYDSSIPKRNMSTNFLADHVAIPPGTLTKVLAVKEQDDRLYVYLSAPSKMPEHVYNIFNGARII
jgi:hypothetical protein